MWQKARIVGEADADQGEVGAEVWVDGRPEAIDDTMHAVNTGEKRREPGSVQYRTHLTTEGFATYIPATSVELLPVFAEAVEREEYAVWRARLTPDPDYTTDTAHHAFVGAGELCARLGCGEHWSWHPGG